jgi:hypothetical protein
VAASASAAPAPLAPEAACERGVGRMLGSLRAPLDITAWVTTGTPELDAFGRLLEALFARYERLAPGKIHARVIRDGDADQRAAATEAGLVEGVLGERGGPPRRRGDADPRRNLPGLLPPG